MDKANLQRSGGGCNRSRLAELLLARIGELCARVEQLERRVADIGDDVDALDRWRRPYGDGTRDEARRRRRERAR